MHQTMPYDQAKSSHAKKRAQLQGKTTTTTPLVYNSGDPIQERTKCSSGQHAYAMLIQYTRSSTPHVALAGDCHAEFSPLETT
jgi:hypothetical protein